MNRLAMFEDHRALLVAIAYRLLGSVAEAEDAVQETWLRWEGTTTVPANPKAFLSTIVTRVAIDALRSARVQREAYPGRWLPEPLADDPYQDPERAAELADSVSMAALVLLERLSPLERAVFVLREVFGFDFGEIAATVERSPVACRQLATRARRHMADGGRRFLADRGAVEKLAARFFVALRDGDVESLRAVLADDARLITDAGGKAPLWGGGVLHGDALVHVLLSVLARFEALGIELEPLELNRAPAAIARTRTGEVLGTWSFDVEQQRIRTILAVTNPDKLAHLGTVADPFAVDAEDRRARRRPGHVSRSDD